MNRRDHHCSPIAPRLLLALIPPSTRRGRARRPVLPAPAHSLTASGDRVSTERRSATDSSVSQDLAGADDLVGQRLLLLDHRVDPLLHRAEADELADLDVAPLPDAERPVGRLVLHRRVPPPVDVDDVAGGGQVEPGPAGLERQQEQRWLVERGELLDHRVPLLLGVPPCRNSTGQPSRAGQVRPQHPAELGVLGEAQRLVAGGDDLVADLLEPGQLARPAGQPGAVGEQVRGMVAHLLELGHRGEHEAAAADLVGGLVDAGEHVGHRGLVQAGLLGGEVAPDLHLLLVRQVRDDRLVGLQPAQHERLGEPLERRRRVRRGVAARSAPRTARGTSPPTRAGRG